MASSPPDQCTKHLAASPPEAFINVRYPWHPHLPRHLSMYDTPRILTSWGIYQCMIPVTSSPLGAFINVRYPSHPHLPRHLSMYDTPSHCQLSRHLSMYDTPRILTSWGIYQCTIPPHPYHRDIY